MRLALIFMLATALVGAAGAYAVYRHLQPQLPEIDALTDVRYQIPMSVYSGDGKLIGQFGEKKRSPKPYAEIPLDLRNAFLAAEDDRFFEHPGVDYQGLLRAVLEFVRTGEKRQGGSTITMQVARNFFLSSEKTVFRKITEIMLAMKIEEKLPKEQILELYLNKIYFGHHAYGVEAAAEIYYDKDVKDLTLAEKAMIAGLPKAPSAFNPIANPDRAMLRRNYVLRRMLKLQFIDQEQFDAAMAEPVNVSLHSPAIELDAPYAAEMVRVEMFQRYGEEAYTNGYKVYTTIDSRLQVAADTALRRALHEYDERHGYRGTKDHIDLRQFKDDKEWDGQLLNFPPEGDIVAGLVVSVKERSADIYVDHKLAPLNWEGIRWARKYLNQDAQGAYPRSAKEVLKPGEVIRLRQSDDGDWMLSQTPKVEGALVSLNPKNGAILAMSGGFDFAHSSFNRVTQAQRQPGSSFKPILYAAALDAGYKPSSVINDAPIVFHDNSPGGQTWRPQNFSGRYYGPTRLHDALVKSRNLVSIRLLQEIGMDKAIETAKLFGFLDSELPRSLTLALGSGTATPLRIAGAYAVFANGGFSVEPYLIERIETDGGGIVDQKFPKVACPDCDDGESRPVNEAPRALTPQVHYMMHGILQDVIQMGTATKAKELGRHDLAGKTGTTNEQRDAWFAGYAPAGIKFKQPQTPEKTKAGKKGKRAKGAEPAAEAFEDGPEQRAPGLVAISWMGFDTPKPLGEGETGGHTALPMWMDFMREALNDDAYKTESAFRVPDNSTETPQFAGEQPQDLDAVPRQGAAVPAAKKRPKKVVAKAAAESRGKRQSAVDEDTSSDEDAPRSSGGGKSDEPLF
ncbi:MAG: penicillin-binding protein 1A [Candidatus Methylumidiphilus sp.]